jgi:thymidylate synthase
MIVFKANSFGEAYRDSLNHVMNNCSENNARGTVSREQLNVALVVEDPRLCLYTNPARSSQMKYIAAELVWYYLGRNDVAFISKWAKFWEQIQNDDGTANSAYGNLIFKMKNQHGLSQYQWAIQSLIKDPYTRQAVMHFNMPIHQYFGNKDFVCTMNVNVHIRENKLHLKLNIRSNDAVWGTPTDAAFFCSLQMQMLNHLREVYPTLELGTYTHVADSYHVYDRHYDLVNKMLENEFVPVKMPMVKNDLINIDGEPTSNLLTLASHIETGTPEFLIFQDEDDICEWIYKNITKTK